MLQDNHPVYHMVEMWPRGKEEKAGVMLMVLQRLSQILVTEDTRYGLDSTEIEVTSIESLIILLY